MKGNHLLWDPWLDGRIFCVVVVVVAVGVWIDDSLLSSAGGIFEIGVSPIAVGDFGIWEMGVSSMIADDSDSLLVCGWSFCGVVGFPVVGCCR